jgi:hypothetical protein
VFAAVTSDLEPRLAQATTSDGAAQPATPDGLGGGFGNAGRVDVIGGAVLLVLVGAVLPLVIAHHYDALRIPRSDDWSYLRALFTWRHTGHLDFNHWVSMTLIAQLVLARPVVAVWSDSITATRVLVAVLGVVGLAAIVAMASAVGVSRRRGLLVALSLASCPLWGPLASTFMTEIPAFAFEMLCLSCACLGWARRREGSVSMPTSYLVGTTVFGFIAVAIRQYAAITLVAVLLAAIVAAWAAGDRAGLRAALLASGAFVVATAVLLFWWSHVPNLRALTPVAPTGISYKEVVRTSGGFLRLAGLMMLPAIMIAGPVRIWRRTWSASRVWSVVFGALAAALLVISDTSEFAPARKSVFVGNYFDPRGVLADDITYGTRPRIMAAQLFRVVTVVGSVAGVVLVLAAVPFVVTAWSRVRRDGRRCLRTWPVDAPRLALGLNVVGFTVGYELAVLFKLPIWDRYALPVLPIVGLLALGPVAAPARPRVASAAARRTASLGRMAGAAVALIAIAGLGVVYSAESASFDATRWQVGEAAVRAGWPIVDVAPGYEWIGWQPGLQRALLQEPDLSAAVAQRRAYERGLCIQIIVNPLRRPHPIVAEATSVGLMRKPIEIYAVREPVPCNAPPKPGAAGT